MKLGIFVGSFNPVHEGHIKVVNYLLDNNYIDRALMLATPNYWNKQDLVELKHRVNMLRFYETKNIVIDDTHNKEPYTYQVLRLLEQDYPEDELYLIIGADNIINFDKWKNIEEILTHKIIVVKRDNIDIEPYLDKFPREQFVIVPSFPFIDVSSTQIRNGDYTYLKEEVKEYINQHGLYKRR